MTANKFWPMCVLALTSGILFADENKVGVTKANSHASELQLETRQVPLEQVLDKIMKETGVRIHYSILPKGLVTAACVGTTIKQVMNYLVNRKADLVFRTQPELTGKLIDNDPQKQPEEVWILGTTMQSGQEPVLSGPEKCTGIAAQPAQMIPANAQTELMKAKPDSISELVEKVRTSAATERADAIALLALAGGKEDASIHDVLENALSDSDANVRAQAVFGLATREGAGAATALHAALQDKEPAVRLMAVDSAGNNAALLLQALADSNETVRALAEIKLEALGETAGSSR